MNECNEVKMIIKMAMGMVPLRRPLIRRLTFRGREGGEELWGAPLIGTSTGWAGNAMALAGSLTAVYQIMQAILTSRNRKDTL